MPNKSNQKAVFISPYNDHANHIWAARKPVPYNAATHQPPCRTTHAAAMQRSLPRPDSFSDAQTATYLLAPTAPPWLRPVCP